MTITVDAPEPRNMGWECPRCHSCYAPHIPRCTRCGPRFEKTRDGWRVPRPPGGRDE